MDFKELQVFNYKDIDIYYAKFSDKVPKSEMLFSFYMSYFHQKKYFASDFYYNNGRPFLKDGSIYFNATNKADKSIIAINKENIGIDMEIIKDKKINLRIIEKYFFEYEKKLIFEENTEYKKIEKFYELWTKKEAYVKLNAKSVFDIKEVDTLNLKIPSFFIDDVVFSVVV